MIIFAAWEKDNRIKEIDEIEEAEKLDCNYIIAVAGDREQAIKRLKRIVDSKDGFCKIIRCEFYGKETFIVL